MTYRDIQEQIPQKVLSILHVNYLKQTFARRFCFLNILNNCLFLLNFYPKIVHIICLINKALLLSCTCTLNGNYTVSSFLHMCFSLQMTQVCWKFREEIVAILQNNDYLILNVWPHLWYHEVKWARLYVQSWGTSEFESELVLFRAWRCSLKIIGRNIVLKCVSGGSPEFIESLTVDEWRKYISFFVHTCNYGL